MNDGAALPLADDEGNFLNAEKRFVRSDAACLPGAGGRKKMRESLRVLVIEDSEDDALQVIGALSRAGYDPAHKRVDSARDLRLALRERPWDIILSGDTMSRFSGMAALRMLRQTDLDIPFILVCDKVGEEKAARAMKAGAHDYVIKGSLARLAPVVKRELSETRMRRKNRQAEDAVRASEARYYDLYASLTDAFLSFFMDGRIMEFNEVCGTMLGYEACELKELTHADITPARWHASETRIVETQVLPLGYSEVYEKEYVRKDGTVFPVELKMFLIKDHKGNPAGMRAIIRDISLRKRVEKALVESETRYRVAIEHSNDGVAIICGDKHTFVNKRFLDIFGYERMDEIVGEPVILTIHPDDRERVLELNLKRQKNEPAPSIYEMKGIKKNGKTVHIEVSATNISFYGESASLAYLRDVTDRKEREKELAESIEKITQAKQEWESLVDSLSELVLLLDDRGCITRSNSVVDSWGLGQPGDVRGQKPHDILHPHCTQSDCYLKHFVAKGLKDSASGTYAELEVKDERLRRYLDIRMRPIETKQDRAYPLNSSFAVLVIHDITERKQAKESLTEAYEELKEAQQELIRFEKLALLGKFSSGIAHEIRNPLANIRASAQFCLAQYELDEEIKKHLRIMLRNSELANKIIKDLIDLAKPSEVSLKPGNTNDLINRVCDLVKTRCEKQHVLLYKKVSRRLPPILMDEERMEKAFLNFVLNALDAMPKGGKLTINAYPYFDGNKVTITIQDTGKGIPEEDFDKIFHPFFTTKRTGIGLGLCLADQVISSHKGKLSVASKAGEGTTITIELAIAREH
jgi:PAS domain S-box-containing protein